MTVRRAEPDLLPVGTPGEGREPRAPQQRPRLASLGHHPDLAVGHSRGRRFEKSQSPAAEPRVAQRIRRRLQEDFPGRPLELKPVSSTPRDQADFRPVFGEVGVEGDSADLARTAARERQHRQGSFDQAVVQRGRGHHRRAALGRRGEKQCSGRVQRARLDAPFAQQVDGGRAPLPACAVGNVVGSRNEACAVDGAAAEGELSERRQGWLRNRTAGLPGLDVSQRDEGEEHASHHANQRADHATHCRALVWRVHGDRCGARRRARQRLQGEGYVACRLKSLARPFLEAVLHDALQSG